MSNVQRHLMSMDQGPPTQFRPQNAKHKTAQNSKRKTQKQHKTTQTPNAKHKTPNAKCQLISYTSGSSVDTKTFCVLGGPNQLISFTSRSSDDTKTFCVVGGPTQPIYYTSGSSVDTKTVFVSSEDPINLFLFYSVLRGHKNFLCRWRTQSTYFLY